MRSFLQLCWYWKGRNVTEGYRITCKEFSCQRLPYLNVGAYLVEVGRYKGAPPVLVLMRPDLPLIPLPPSARPPASAAVRPTVLGKSFTPLVK